MSRAPAYYLEPEHPYPEVLFFRITHSLIVSFGFGVLARPKVGWAGRRMRKGRRIYGEGTEGGRQGTKASLPFFPSSLLSPSFLRFALRPSFQVPTFHCAVSSSSSSPPFLALGNGFKREQSHDDKLRQLLGYSTQLISPCFAPPAL